jgi:hypothetical protein
MYQSWASNHDIHHVRGGEDSLFEAGAVGAFSIATGIGSSINWCVRRPVNPHPRTVDEPQLRDPCDAARTGSGPETFRTNRSEQGRIPCGRRRRRRRGRCARVIGLRGAWCSLRYGRGWGLPHLVRGPWLSRSCEPDRRQTRW